MSEVAELREKVEQAGMPEEIKARGQVIVGLMHEDIGHLGIFVSGKVARKEHAQIVSVLKSSLRASASMGTFWASTQPSIDS